MTDVAVVLYEWMPPSDFKAEADAILANLEPDPPVSEQTIAPDVRNDAVPEENQ